MALGSSRRPGILDEGFLENVPNVFPAGSGPWISGQPTAGWPTPGVNKAFGSSWLSEVNLPIRWEQDPRGIMEEPSGFGSEGRSAAMQAIDFPFFPFFGWPGFGVPQPQTPAPSEQSPATEPDYLGIALNAGGELLKNLTQGGGKPPASGFVNPSTGPFGPEGMPPGLGTGDVNPAILEADGFGYDADPATIAAIKQSADIELLSNLTGGTGVPAPFVDPTGPYQAAFEAAEMGGTGNPAALGGGGVPGGAGFSAAIAAAPHAFKGLHGMTGYKGFEDAGRFMGSPAIQIPAMGLSGPLGAIGGLAVLGSLIGMKAAGVGAQDKRTARDAEAVREAGEMMTAFLTTAKTNPNALQEFKEYFNTYDPRVILQGIHDNRRLPITPEQWNEIRRTVEVFEATRKDINEGRVPGAVRNLNLSPEQLQQAQTLANRKATQIREQKLDWERMKADRESATRAELGDRGM